LVTGGTDNHLLLIDLSNRTGTNEITGKDSEIALDLAGITVNKNTVPNEKRSPFVTSGFRIGSPALTTRGMKEAEMKIIAGWICDVLEDHKNETLHKKIHGQIKELCKKFPIYNI
jgi:glycine hydroxymethyltransferase